MAGFKPLMSEATALSTVPQPLPQKVVLASIVSTTVLATQRQHIFIALYHILSDSITFYQIQLHSIRFNYILSDSIAFNQIQIHSIRF